MIRKPERGPVLDQEPPGEHPIVTRRLGADHQVFKCHEHGCEDSGRLLCWAARQSCHQKFLVQDVVQLTVSEAVLWRDSSLGLQEHHRVVRSFEGAPLARLLETDLQVLCELTKLCRVGELMTQSQPGEEALDTSDSGPKGARPSSASGELIPWL